MHSVKASVGVIIRNDRGQVLMARRLGSHAGNTWSIPGGKADFGERMDDCARREVLEETGISLGALTFLGVTNNLETATAEALHYVSLIFLCEDFRGTPQVTKPDKLGPWQWFTPSALPSPQFEASRKAIALLDQPAPALIEE